MDISPDDERDATVSVTTPVKRKPTSKQHVLAFDIETTGCNLQSNAIMSIGASVQDEDMIEVDMFSVNLEIPKNKKFEEKCVLEVWSKHPEALARATENPIAPVTAMRSFEKWLDAVEEKYENLTIISDNPAFDMQWLNFYLNQYTGRRPINYDKKEKYRLIWDSHSMMRVMTMLSGDMTSEWGLPEKIGIQNMHPDRHDSLEDARNIACHYIQLIKKIKKTKIKAVSECEYVVWAMEKAMMEMETNWKDFKSPIAVFDSYEHAKNYMDMLDALLEEQSKNSKSDETYWVLFIQLKGEPCHILWDKVEEQEYKEKGYIYFGEYHMIFTSAEDCEDYIAKSRLGQTMSCVKTEILDYEEQSKKSTSNQEEIFQGGEFLDDLELAMYKDALKFRRKHASIMY